MDSLGRIAAIVIAVILLFLFPLRYDAAAQEQTLYSYKNMKMEHFWHDISTKRVLSRERFLQFSEDLATADFTGQIIIERYPSIVYTDMASEEVVLETYEYEDLLSELKSKEEIFLNQGDYISISLTQSIQSTTEKIKNLLIPFVLYPEEMHIGGRVH